MPGLDLWRRHRQTVGLALMALVVALGCVGLSRWQYHRFEHKHDAKQLVQRNYGARAVPLADLMADPDQPFDPADQWRRVQVTGQYDTAATTLVRNRPHDDGDSNPTYGYEVLVPLVLSDGSALLVDRGWVPNGTEGTNPGQEPDVVPAPPSGTVQVVARLRPSEPHRGQRVPEGQVASIDVPQIARSTGLDLYPAYGALVSEVPPATPAPVLLGKPELDGGEGINASYAVQWLLFAALALGFPWWFVRRNRRAAELEERAADGTTAAPVPVPRRRRIWDDEDE
ncbi:SURF1 family cytochrome oxidase biogenesis protein [Angustibacter luteus]|uniref:SURF1-like protein n=1 Tax=Angustibacter luteus TaxID=658456 RepID=A0ABW1J9Z0_9ACTN